MMERKTNIVVPTKLRILTNDPSLTAWGWAVVDENSNVMVAGCIKTQPTAQKLRVRKGDDRTRRITEINTVLLDVIRLWDVNYILSELPHGSQSAVSAVMIGITAGIMQTISDCKQIPIEWYSEADSKKSVLKKKSATKDDMLEEIKNLYPNVVWTGVGYKDEAVADALAIHHCAKLNSSFLKFYK